MRYKLFLMVEEWFFNVDCGNLFYWQFMVNYKKVLYYNIIIIIMQVFGLVIKFVGCFDRYLDKGKIVIV